MKLVRDKIPDIMEADGCTNLQIQRLNDSDYTKALSLKLVEEVAEAATEIQEGNREGIIEELADLEEVLAAIKKNSNISSAEIEERRVKKKQTRGGFEKRIWLEAAEVYGKHILLL